MTEPDASLVADTRPSLKTGRLTLRPFSLDDEEAVFTICREKEIAANTRTIPHPYPRDQAAHWIKQHPELWQNGKAAIFAICETDSEELVGAIGLEIDEVDQNAELDIGSIRSVGGKVFVRKRRRRSCVSGSRSWL